MKIRYYHLDTVGSTNTWAKEHAAEFERDALTVISADSQTQGRGRYSRVWHSPSKKNLYLTLALFLPDSSVQPFALCQLASLALEEFFAFYGIESKIKWPNDLLVNGKKIVGVLTERQEIDSLSFLVIGIGLNVNMSLNEVTELGLPATSMLIEKQQSYSLDTVKDIYVRLFLKRLLEAKATHFRTVWSHWQKSLQWMLEQPVCVQTAACRIDGKVVELDSEGSLVIELPNGTKQTIHTADINL